MDDVLITGVSRGLGLELARGYLDSGHRVIGVARSPAPLDHPRFHPLCGDVTGPDYERGLRDFVHQCGVTGFALVVNNAGVSGSGAHIDTIDPAHVRAQFELHCMGALRTVQAVLPWLDGSKIIQVTSRLGSTAFNARGDFRDREFSYAYRIAKAAQNMLGLCMADDAHLAGNIVASVIPGRLLTDSAASDAEYSARDGSAAMMRTIAAIQRNGIYHAFGDEAAY